MNIETIYKKFPQNYDCIKYLEFIRWGNTPKCSYCESTKTTLLTKENRYHCNRCNTSFSVTVGTIFQNTYVPLQKWFIVIDMILNGVKISSRSVGKIINVDKDTANRMIRKIIQAIKKNDQRQFLNKIVKDQDVWKE